MFFGLNIVCVKNVGLFEGNYLVLSFLLLKKYEIYKS